MAKQTHKLNKKLLLNNQNGDDGPIFLPEVGAAIIAAKQKSKDEVFDFIMQQFSEPTLQALLDSVNRSKNEDAHQVGANSVMLLGVFLRGHLHGNSEGAFQADEDELVDIVNTLGQYFVIEFLRRRGCFGYFEMPKSPWVFNAVVRVREPNRPNIAATIALLNEMGLPYPPLLTDEETLNMMETKSIGVEMGMGVQGKPIADPQMLNIQYHKLPALNPDKFRDALDEINEVLSGAKSLPPSHLPPIDMVDSSGGKQELNTQNNPHLQIARVISRHFPDSLEEATSANARLVALTRLISAGSLNNWMVQDGNKNTFHPAVVETAALLKLTPDGAFPAARFATTVKRLTTEKPH